MAASSTSLGTSNLRSAPRPTRINSSRAVRTARASLRQSSQVSNPGASIQGATEPQGFYPAITAFSDAIAALPRDYRRHTSLLKEVDAKAWSLEESLQQVVLQCLHERQTPFGASAANTIAGSTINMVDSMNPLSATASVNGMALDNMSQYSGQGADPSSLQRRQLYTALRHNLMQMMVTMDEKNHVINNANEDLSRHIRRLDNLWPHIADELSEEVRLGSLKHWAYTETNPIIKKTAAASTSRREAAAGLAIMGDNDIAQRSESRREAMHARQRRLNQPVDSDFDEKAGRRNASGAKNRKPDMSADAIAGVGTVMTKKKTTKGLGGVAMERATSARMGGSVMSREPSQQDHSKKRKAPTAASTAARKRLNPGAHESPKLASSPLAGMNGKDAVKRSPALSSVRPVARARQNSTQSDISRNKPSLTNGRHASNANSETSNIMAAAGRSTSELKQAMKEYANSKGDKFVEEGRPTNGEFGRGGILLERSSSRQGGLKREAQNEGQSVRSPRLGTSTTAHEGKGSRNRASKVSTPILASFDEVDTDSGAGGQVSENGINGSKAKRAPRPRMKDHHGLQDSLSPKGLPMKRAHNKTSSLSSLSAIPMARKPSSSRTRDREQTRQRDTEELTPAMSRTNSRSANNTSTNNLNLATISTTTHSTPTNSQPPSIPRNVQSSDEGSDPADTDMYDDERYCFCNGPSYGEMVACDNKNCAREWFHLGCIGLKKLPSAAKWYCDECKGKLISARQDG